ncbi:CU044_2847 family protein [Streptomyces sp. NBC_00124]|uniref:CU044_2847 family protein n=1 Tax=Streptomyces sp. NBC_00124 TaxID=2975662 RepID=UPI00224E8EE0|nr:CU044_2847 family protein [Streptomyces sp. NBC_00124]MCX5360044.1 CU044_2847 family protein [Streptomyces sp. NBC_00124]
MAIVIGVTGEGRDGPVYVEVEAAQISVYDGIDTRGNPAERVLEAARDVYADGLDLAKRCARQAAERLGDLGEGFRPDEVELSLSIKLDAELGAVLVKSGAEAQLQVTFRWMPGGAS